MSDAMSGCDMATAAATGRIVADMLGRGAGGVATALVLGTPWVIVVGSLGYNEMVVALLLAVGLVLVERGVDSWRGGAAIGLLCGAACGAKLTAIGLVALPLAVVMLGRMPLRRWPRPAIAAGLAAAAALGPWLIRTGLHLGNPLFPIGTGL